MPKEYEILQENRWTCLDFSRITFTHRTYPAQGCQLFSFSLMPKT